MSRLECCPLCLNEVPGWAAACPRCNYHPDRYYNRAQDDIALLFRLNSDDRGDVSPAPANTGAGESPGWRTWLPHWLGRGDAQPPRANA